MARILFALAAMSALAAAPRSVWEGVYSKAQAERGLKAYREECLKCHGETLLGGEGGPAISGDEFLSKWNGKTAGDLYAREPDVRRRRGVEVDVRRPCNRDAT